MKILTFCIMSIVLLIAANAESATIYVNSNLQAAIDAAKPGDTILVAPGIYEKITIQKSLNLIGNGATIRTGNREACVSVESDNVAISGFLIRDGFYGIKLNYAKGCTISNNTVVRCTQPGIALLFSDKNKIIGNNASFNGLGGEGWYGIYLSNSNDNLIRNNVASNNGAYGINLFPYCNNNTIEENTLEGNMNGLYMYTNCANNSIRSNTMSQNTNMGIYMLLNCHDNLLMNNTIANNVVAGICLKDSEQNDLHGNSIHGNKRYGLEILGSSENNRIINNTISESQTGIFIESNGNNIFGNHLSDNVVQADDRGSNSWNAPYPKGGNLWSDYIGQDDMRGQNQDMQGSDGFGDKPYEISETAKDEYPVMGAQERQIEIVDKSLSSVEVRSGDNIAVKAKLKSKYEVSQATVRAFQSGIEAKGYSRLIASGDLYQGSFSTALLDPGKYELILDAKDTRGHDTQEDLGEIVVRSRNSPR